MQDDLLHAQASVDWAVSQFPAFQARLDTWLHANLYTAIVELPPNAPNDVVVAREKEPLPLHFQVEVGAYINAIRSSLDILSATLASRHCPGLIDDAYFPIVASAQIFDLQRFKGHKFVQALPSAERSIIEALEPYKRENGRGNDLLYALHKLDIVRKHVRLLAVEVRPQTIGYVGWDLQSTFTPVATAWMRSADNEAVLGLLAKGAPRPQIDLTMQISLIETNYLVTRPIITALDDFATLAKAIIQKFDFT